MRTIVLSVVASVLLAGCGSRISTGSSLISGSPPGAIAVSASSAAGVPIAAATPPATTPPIAATSADPELIPAQAGVYTFAGGGATMSPPPAGSMAKVSRTAAIASATRQADLEADLRTTAPSVSYGLLLEASGTPKLVVDVRWLDVLGMGALGGAPASGVSTPVPISTNSPQDINVILDPTTGVYIEEFDDGRA